MRDVAHYAALYEHSILFGIAPRGEEHYEERFLNSLAKWFKAEQVQRASQPGSRPLVLNLIA